MATIIASGVVSSQSHRSNGACATINERILYGTLEAHLPALPEGKSNITLKSVPEYTQDDCVTYHVNLIGFEPYYWLALSCQANSHNRTHLEVVPNCTQVIPKGVSLNTQGCDGRVWPNGQAIITCDDGMVIQFQPKKTNISTTAVPSRNTTGTAMPTRTTEITRMRNSTVAPITSLWSTTGQPEQEMPIGYRALVGSAAIASIAGIFGGLYGLYKCCKRRNEAIDNRRREIDNRRREEEAQQSLKESLVP